MAAAALGDVHEVICETDSAAGLGRILSEPAFDVVLCDLMMPGLTGMDIYESVARDRPGLEERMVFLTGGPYTQRATAFLESVPNRKFLKPISAARLSEIVSTDSG
jgi:CheY-like chemotaxis protein